MPSPWSDRFGVPSGAGQALEAALSALACPGLEADAAQDRLRLEQLLERLRDARAPLDWLSEPRGPDALVRIAHGAPYLLRHLGADPKRVGRGVLAHLDAGALASWSAARGEAFAALDEARALAALRRWKYDCYARLTARSLLGLADAAETCAAVTAVAEGLIRAALVNAFAAQVSRHGLPLCADGRLAGLAVIGMGKLGGGELNYSSDIDLILVHDGDDAPCRAAPPRAAAAPEDPTADDAGVWERWQALGAGAGAATELSVSTGEFCQRVGRYALRLLSTETTEGLCFRTDADLRPQGRSGMLVPSLAFAARYYEEQGREWERTALIKARCVAGAARAGARFAGIVRPFVYRRYLDFSALEGVALIKHDIDRHHGGDGEGDLKVGRGGIRESEFLVQALQLVHGGRVPALQVPGHRDAVRALAAAGLLPEAEAEALLRDYWTLRAAENRVQMLDEAQVHALPTEPGLRRRALTDFLPGFAGRQAQAEGALAATRARTAERYQRLFARLMPGEVAQGSDWRRAMQAHVPPAEAPAVQSQVDAALNRLMRTRQGERCVFKLERLLTRPEVYAAGTEPALPRWLAFLEQIGNRNALYALMEAHPEALPWVSRIFTEGGRHAPPLIRHPEFLESFLALRPGEGPDTGPALRERFHTILNTARDEEEFLLDVQTANAHARLLILSGYLDRDARATGADGGHRERLTELAETVVDVCARYAWRYAVPRLGAPQLPGAPEGAAAELGGFAILALGKLGSRDLRFGSDLDLVFVYRGEGTTAKGRSHWEFYTKLAQKLTALLSAPTQFGVLHELDHRLRPFGGKGLLVPSLAGYESFLAKEAEIWNFQAFTRARHLCGEAHLSAEVLGRVARAWMLRGTPPRDVAREVLDMARRLAAHAPAPGTGRVQLKYALGGMLGFEFLRQCHFLLARQRPGGDRAGGPDPRAAEPAELAAGWTPPGDHEMIRRLSPDYDTLGALDERVSFYVERYRHEVDAETFRRYAGVGRRWSHDRVLAVCQRMQAGVEAEFRRLSG